MPGSWYVRFARTIALMSMLAVALQTAAQAREELKLSVAVGTALPLGKAAARWSEALEARNAFTATVQPGAVLAGRDPAREFGALRDGAADIAVGSALAWATQVPALMVYNLPFLASEPQALAALAADGTVQKAIGDEMERRGVLLLAMAPLGHRALATRDATVAAPGDLRDLRVRVPAYPTALDLYTTLRARPASLSFAQSQAAIAAGELDAEDGLPSALASARVAALGFRQVLHWGAIADVMIFAVRRAVWDRVGDAGRDALLATAREEARKSTALADEEAALVELRRQGATVQRLSPAQREAFRDASAEVVQKWSQPVGTELVEAAKRAVAGAPAR